MTSSTNWPCVALPNAELAARTTMHVGGRAEWLLEPAHPVELREAWCAARERGYMPRILGGGANVLISDGVLPGVVIATDRMRYVFRPDRDASSKDAFDEDGGPRSRGLDSDAEAEDAGDARLVAWCGATLPKLVTTAQRLGWSGLEGLVGVPGQLGGGVAMNAGGRWGNMWDVVDTVRVLDSDGELLDIRRSEHEPAYRDGRLGDRMVVGAVLALTPDDKARVRDRTREFLHEKNAVQPVTEWSSGCIFKNPDPELSEDRSAGRLVDECGGKGLERGDAIVSPLHGNFIVNRGKATATDVFTLIEDVRDLVDEKTGIRLECEVRRWGP